MKILATIVIIWLSVLTVAVIIVYIRKGSHLNELEDELWPECECRKFMRKNGKL